MTSLLYLGTGAGVVVLRSADGHAWEEASHALQSWEVPMVAVSPTTPHHVFAGTRGDGVWMSDDCGASWRKPCFGRRGPGKVRSITVDPSDPDRVYAGTEPIDLFVSPDGARSWTRLDAVWDQPWAAKASYPQRRAIEPHVRDIAVDPLDPKTIYIGLQVGYILKSTDGGGSWRVLDKGLDADVHAIGIHPRRSREMWIATGGDFARAGLADGKALYRSEDAGESWQPMALAEFPDHEYGVPLAVNPSRPDTLYAAVASGPPSSWERKPEGAGCLVIRSRDAGLHWERAGAGLGELARQFIEAMAVDPEEPDRLYVAFRSGTLCVSEDGGGTWERLNVQVPDVQDLKLVRVY